MSETRCKTCNDAREVWDGGIEAVKAAARVPCPDCAAPPPQEPGREEMVAWLNHQRYKNDGTPVNAAHNAMLDRIIAALASSPAPASGSGTSLHPSQDDGTDPFPCRHGATVCEECAYDRGFADGSAAPSVPRESEDAKRCVTHEWTASTRRSRIHPVMLGAVCAKCGTFYDDLSIHDKGCADGMEANHGCSCETAHFSECPASRASSANTGGEGV